MIKNKEGKFPLDIVCGAHDAKKEHKKPIEDALKRAIDKKVLGINLLSSRVSSLEVTQKDNKKFKEALNKIQEQYAITQENLNKQNERFKQELFVLQENNTQTVKKLEEKHVYQLSFSKKRSKRWGLVKGRK